MNTIKLLDVVTLMEDLPEEGLQRGAIGTVVEQWNNGVFEVEFSDDTGKAYAFASVRGEHLMKLYGLKKTLQEWLGASKIVALVFTDIVDSTSLGNQLGDEQWFEVLRKHFEQARLLMSAYDCYEIKIIGDSFMVTFRDAVDALDFVIAFHSNTGDERIFIRAGIHVGPVRVIENDIFGMMVNYTKRVESQAGNDPVIMLSDEAKNHIDYEKATRHSHLEFSPSEATLKGFAEPQKLWSVFDTEAFRKALTTKIPVPKKKSSVVKKLLLG